MYISLYVKFTSILKLKGKIGGMFSVSKANGQKILKKKSYVEQEGILSKLFQNQLRNDNEMQRK